MSGANLVLAGLMGSGKSTVGRVLAQWLDRQFVDTDALVAQATGRSVPELFAEQGEEAFRELEAQAIEAVCEREGLVVAVGGGAVVDPRSATRLRESSHVVVLDASPGALADRVRPGQRSGRRPLLDGNEDVAARLAELQRDRERAYDEVAHARFDTTGRSIEEVAALVAAWLEERG